MHENILKYKAYSSVSSVNTQNNNSTYLGPRNKYGVPKAYLLDSKERFGENTVSIQKNADLLNQSLGCIHGIFQSESQFPLPESHDVAELINRPE